MVVLNLVRKSVPVFAKTDGQLRKVIADLLQELNNTWQIHGFRLSLATLQCS